MSRCKPTLGKAYAPLRNREPRDRRTTEEADLYAHRIRLARNRAQAYRARLHRR